ncbi:MAG: hypothetical protein CVU56_05285 [Deltaproteobacteria bacterium HGW-Deltaproteobacteria-14]|nr:MAG: hypothetical protein CVU56_05285 [Deltaproteobacteria bacterium HGW-Deltaproteobacteria-14]
MAATALKSSGIRPRSENRPLPTTGAGAAVGRAWGARLDGVAVEREAVFAVDSALIFPIVAPAVLLRPVRLAGAGLLLRRSTVCRGEFVEVVMNSLAFG